MSENYFQMKDLSVGYHGNVLIHDICTEIKKGEILTLIGPNGSGKSTILKSITNQIVGYIMSGDPTYITSYKNARSMIMKVERDELVEELLKEYIKNRTWEQK